jgi:hypothetical protein
MITILGNYLKRTDAINDSISAIFNKYSSLQYDVIYVDNCNNFYTYKEVAKQSGLKWLFIVFDERKECICNKEMLPCIRIRPILSFCYSAEYHSNFSLFKTAIKQDRILKFYPYCIASRILDNQLLWFKNIITATKPKLVIGEISWGTEYLFYEFCKQRNIRYRHLLNLPHINNKIVLFDADHSYASLAENLLGITDDKISESHNVSYYDLCNKLKEFNQSNKKVFLNVVLNLLNIKQQINDYRTNQLYHKIRFFVLKLYIIAEKILFNIFKPASNANEIIDRADGRNIIYFPLHIQPESTPDFVSIKYSNQLKLLNSILKSLPKSFVVAVKDHPNAISIRNIFFLLKLLNSKQLIFVKRKIRSQEIIKISACTASVAGTVALESISCKVPSIVFSNIFYNRSQFVSNARDIDEFVDLLRNIKSKDIYNDLNLSDFGINGFIHDPLIFNEVFELSNIQNISLLIDSYTTKYQAVHI